MEKGRGLTDWLLDQWVRGVVGVMLMRWIFCLLLSKENFSGCVRAGKIFFFTFSNVICLSGELFMTLDSLDSPIWRFLPMQSTVVKFVIRHTALIIITNRWESDAMKRKSYRGKKGKGTKNLRHMGASTVCKNDLLPKWIFFYYEFTRRARRIFSAFHSCLNRWDRNAVATSWRNEPESYDTQKKY